jgi:hypothetical protein
LWMASLVARVSAFSLASPRRSLAGALRHSHRCVSFLGELLGIVCTAPVSASGADVGTKRSVAMQRRHSRRAQASASAPYTAERDAVCGVSALQRLAAALTRCRWPASCAGCPGLHSRPHDRGRACVRMDEPRAGTLHRFLASSIPRRLHCPHCHVASDGMRHQRCRSPRTGAAARHQSPFGSEQIHRVHRWVIVDRSAVGACALVQFNAEPNHWEPSRPRERERERRREFSAGQRRTDRVRGPPAPKYERRMLSTRSYGIAQTSIALSARHAS